MFEGEERVFVCVRVRVCYGWTGGVEKNDGVKAKEGRDSTDLNGEGVAVLFFFVFFCFFFVNEGC